MKSLKLLFLAIFTGAVISSGAQAASFDLPAYEDAYWTNFNFKGQIANGIEIGTAKYDAGNNFAYVLLNFRLYDNSSLYNSLANGDIEKMTLNLHNIQTYNDPDTRVYYFNDNTWLSTLPPAGATYFADTESPLDLNTFNPDSNIALLDTGDSYNGRYGAVTRLVTSSELNLSFLNNVQNDVFSLIVADAKGEYSSDAFFSKDYDTLGTYTPYLTIETSGASAPVPEPSSIILGLLGASGVLGLRRRKNA